MFRSTLMASALAAPLAASYLGTAEADKTGGYVETDLVTNKAPLKDANGIVHPLNNNPNAIVDGNLVNPWGITWGISATTGMGTPFWVSDNGKGVATLYGVTTTTPLKPTKNARVVSIPAPPPGDPLGSKGTPTGDAWNPTVGPSVPTSQQEFKIPGYLFTATPSCSFSSAPAAFLFATEDGTIVGWNSNLYPTQALCTSGGMGNNNNGIIAKDNSAGGAVYKGLAVATDPSSGQTFLYATNFHAGHVEIYNGTWGLVTTFPDAFTDPKLPNGYAPFNVVPVTLDGNVELFVTFAKQDAAKHDDVAGEGHGIVDTFDLSGNMLRRFAQHGQLNSPWGVALTPPTFGELANTIWIGNFGNGHINAYDLFSGKQISKVRDPKGKDIVIDGLWGLKVGNNGAGGSSETLFFTAGPNGESDGLFGSLTPNGG
jgi:uncharacterized protein (TIGR03118 family)